ncbi:MAG: BMP family ABC transporter substrate-binding protein [Treponema sp.]|nr:BMP family ABC transporter substrate-binding protein [Treponema sp.]
MKKSFLILSSIFMLFTACTSQKKSAKSVAVFVPGVVSGSPVYEMLVEGANAAVDSYNLGKSEDAKTQIFVLEAGTNQAEWGNKILALASEQKYDLIISSNPSLPELILPVIEQFPSQKFIVLDAELSGNANMYTVCYNQYEQAYLTGFIGGLMSKSHKLGLVAAQEYPVMNNIIAPYFEKGAQAAANGSTMDFRVVGNWYDGNKGAQIADALIAKGVDVILPICGGASQGVINSAKNAGIYITWFDNNGFDKAPGTIISSSVMKQKEMAQIAVSDYLNGKTAWGKADMVGIKEGFVDFVQDDPNYINTVPADVRAQMADLIAKIKAGELEIK